MAPIVFRARQMSQVSTSLISTGQHRHLLDRALRDFHLTPDYDLNVMQPDQSLSELTGRILSGLASIFAREKPDAVLVQGDTTTAFCGALAAFYAGAPVYHIEAGLRSHRMDAPFPEEANRSLISRLAKLHFAPTPTAQTNLLREGIAASAIHVTGNTVVDALQWMQARLPQMFPGDPALLSGAAEVAEGAHRFILVTAHRREHFGEGIAQLCDALRQLAHAFPDVHLLFPVHCNPHVVRPVQTLLSGHKNIHLLPPLDYAPFVWLMQRCHFIITDSGGIQEEAATLSKPLIITRTVTERAEAVTAQSAVLTGADAASILACARRLLTDAAFYRTMAKGRVTYGDGRAAARIVQAIESDLAGEAMREVAL